MAPLRGPLRRYYTPYEVAQHNTPEDCWVSFLGEVYELTRLIQRFPGKITEPIIKAAGTDISHWFDAKTRTVKTIICPVTELERFYTPMVREWWPAAWQGRFPHVPPIEPVNNWDTSFGIPWWRDKKYQASGMAAGAPGRQPATSSCQHTLQDTHCMLDTAPTNSCQAHRTCQAARCTAQHSTLIIFGLINVGLLSARIRIIRIKNVLTGQEDHLEASHPPACSPLSSRDSRSPCGWRLQIAPASQCRRLMVQGVAHVPSEETVVEIRERYSELNAHAQSYTFKALVTVPQPGSDKAEMQFQELDMNKTLLENGVPDETSTFEQLMIPTDAFVPVLHVYWNDDLTAA
ncbi:hypothetical protein QJQ45_015789 [Haematococcus lacustris]|nr:hypothetical protein QJQ45_015789 [Haematococcus lacustris]